MKNVYATLGVLRGQAIDSRFRNTLLEITTELSKQHDLVLVPNDLRLNPPEQTAPFFDLAEECEMPTDLFRQVLVQIVSSRFLFIRESEAAHMVARSSNLNDLVFLILEKVGPVHDDTTSKHAKDSQTESLFGGTQSSSGAG